MIENVTCPWCEHKFQIDVRQSHKPFECPGCKSEDYRGQLVKAIGGSKAVTIGASITDGVMRSAYRASLAYAFEKDGKLQFASGTIVDIGGRFLLATTGHSIPHNRKLGSVRFVPKHPDDKPIGALSALASDEYDVGVMEIAAQAVEELDASPIGIERLHDARYGDPLRKAWLLGYPGAFQVKNYGQRGVLGFEGLLNSCVPIDPAAWKNVPVGYIDRERKEYDELIDVLVHYPQEPHAAYVADEEKFRDTMAPDPHGMSGGGFWQFPHPLGSDEIWNPDRVSLFAIQSRWPKHGEHLHGIQIIHWLKLVAEHFPELREVVFSRFSRAREMGK